MLTRKNSSNDVMKEIYEKELDLQMRIYGDTWPNDINRCIREYAMHLQVETVEMLQETNFKRKRKWRGVDFEKLQGEIVDVFLVALATATLSFESYEHFIAAIQKKMNHNNNRKDWEVNNQ